MDERIGPVTNTVITWKRSSGYNARKVSGKHQFHDYVQLVESTRHKNADMHQSIIAIQALMKYRLTLVQFERVCS